MDKSYSLRRRSGTCAQQAGRRRRRLEGCCASRVLGRWNAPDRPVRSLLVVIMPPRLDAPPRILDTDEVLRVEARVPKLVIEAFDKPVLHRLAGIDEVEPNTLAPRPRIHLSPAKLRSVVRDDHRGVSTDRRYSIKYASHDDPGKRCADLDGQALSAEVVDHIQDAELSSVRERVAHEVHRPSCVDAESWRQRLTADAPQILAATPRELQPLLAVQPIDALVIHHRPSPSNPIEHQPVPDPRTFRRKLAHLLPQLSGLIRPRFVARRRTVHRKHVSRPPLTDAKGASPMRGYKPARSGLHHFRDRASWSICLSSVKSATTRLSRPFSASSCFRRFASETSIPANFFRQMEMVARLTPNCRTASAIGIPPSIAFTTLTICSSVNLFPFMPGPRPARIYPILARTKW